MESSIDRVEGLAEVSGGRIPYRGETLTDTSQGVLY